MTRLIFAFRIMALALAVQLMPFLASTASAEPIFPPKPAAGVFFVDAANVLSHDEQNALNAVSEILFQDENIPLIAVTISSLVDYNALQLTHAEYARRLFDHWGIGSQERNYGMLILVAPADRAALIEFGAGFANQYNDEAEAIMRDIMIPAFKRGEFGEGLVDAAYALDGVARGLGLPNNQIPLVYFAPLLLIFVVLALMFARNLFKTGRRGWAWVVLGFTGLIVFFILRQMLRGGGGAFGGGSGGGGGASGSW